MERLQLTEGVKNSSLIRGKQQIDKSPFNYDTSWELDNNLDESLQHPLGLDADPHQELKEEHSYSSFLPLEHLALSPTIGNPMPGETFWQCKSPPRNFQVLSFLLIDTNQTTVIEAMNYRIVAKETDPSLLLVPRGCRKFSFPIIMHIITGDRVFNERRLRYMPVDFIFS